MAPRGTGGVLIRTAKREDLPRIVEMGQHFRSEPHYERYMKDDPECMKKMAERLIDSQTMLVSETEGRVNGMLGFIVYPHFISGETTAGEVVWWVEPEHRGQGIRLLAEMEHRARLAGAKHLQMIAPNSAVAHIYIRRGYEFVESTFQRNLM